MSVLVTLPEWVDSKDYFTREFKTDEEMMALAIELSEVNISEGTGGPFGCAIYERNFETGKVTLIAVGVNRVTALGNSCLHGETVAIQMAQKKLNTFTLDIPENKLKKHYELFTSCEPCCMCLGATLWSGVARMVCGATKADACAIGFDEGPVFEASYDHLKKSGIDITRNVLRDEAAAVLKRYGETGLMY
uniref:CMP/dCMP-type deaminase domain-containing protein n=1 Tax=Attheya septentrionalis TaxID=420275 RepID=A0A6T7IGB9_9STRA|mmetsp:Transcript_25547/g.46281  ORF Transcript_25547/g.46281 Transcript_25547/m.46281 type:complete len:191 (+) Transcript_25547:185-757(+)|eukprot:CAMPEP_0198293674 /NCGR_PEP_ID=MMETSP1449-20131203/18378_1 /TAXON_ID=420275 /ORGANISM="Attheya septentrionalis, Strain CCMP2084" /LENGTH=190 /DNA_ID=CAMNT_0043993345 /DNA_START=161 /DNA_END=733 /DNA_ORIENTATION=+